MVDRIKSEFDFRQTAAGGVNWVILTVTPKLDAGFIEVPSGEIGQNRFDSERDVYLALNHCSIGDRTDYGRKCLDAWVKEQKQDRLDLAKFNKLKLRFEQDK